MKRFLLSNHSEILFDEERASLLSMKVEGEELLSSAAPFFALRFRSKKAETKTIDSFSFHFLTPPIQKCKRFNLYNYLIINSYIIHGIIKDFHKYRLNF